MPGEGTRIHFIWMRPRTCERIRIEALYHADCDAWEIVRAASDEEGHEGEPVELTSSDRAELDYVAGDEYRSDLERESLDLAERR